MLRILRLLGLAALPVMSAFPQDVAGDWQGKLKAGGSELRLVLHLSKNGAAWQGSMDSPDQGAAGIPIAKVKVSTSSFSFDVPSIGGSYQGKLNAAGTEIEGSWNQGMAFPLNLSRLVVSKSGPPSDIAGAWVGKLNAGPVPLAIVFHFAGANDSLTATLDSPDQNAYGIPAGTVTRSGSTVKVLIPSLGAEFEGSIYRSPASINGTFKQGGGSFPLLLSRAAEGALERKRPQMPVKPYPYREEEVTYKNAAAGITLAGTLTIPPGKGPFPAVVLIAGSGPNDRDESLMGHKPFLVLADYLTRHGIVVLRSDKRGIGKSGGDLEQATTADFAGDADAGFAYLTGRKEVDPRRAGLIGHSEGGGIAPFVAARNPHVAFIVMMAGPAVRGDEMMVRQVMRLVQASGASAADVDKAGANQREILAMVTSGKDNAAIEKRLREMDEGKTPAGQRDANIQAGVAALTSKWYRYMLAFDPGQSVRKMKCPVLALYGEQDTQVDAKQNLAAMREALKAGGNTHGELVELPGLNHLFQTAKTGLPAEYGDIEETLAPAVLQKIAAWIVAQH